MKKWWNAEMLANSGFQRARDKDEQAQAEHEAKAAKGAKGEKGEKAAKGAKGAKGANGAKEAAAAQWKGS